MEKTLEKKLTEVGAQVLKLYLRYTDDSELGKQTKQLVKTKLNKVLKKHYLKSNNNERNKQTTKH